MPEKSRHTPGTPCWVDIATPDPEEAADFYAALFGWEVRPAEQAPGYRMARLDGRPVAGLGRTGATGRPWWTSYFAVLDAASCVRSAAAMGAEVIDGPREVPGLGCTALLCDPAGAAFALWQAGGFHGAGLVDEPGALCWTELAVRDADAAAAFYQAIFGWEGRAARFAGEIGGYTEFLAGDETVAGMVRMDDEWPPDIPPHWMGYFAVADCDESAARVEELGGTVSIPPFDGESGRIAVADDPHGAVFSIVELA